MAGKDIKIPVDLVGLKSFYPDPDTSRNQVAEDRVVAGKTEDGDSNLKLLGLILG